MTKLQNTEKREDFLHKCIEKDRVLHERQGFWILNSTRLQKRT